MNRAILMKGVKHEKILLNVILVLAIVLFLRYVHYSLEPEPSNQPDTYSNFSSLAENESPADYDISYNEKKGSKVLIMSPHGGRIEGGVSELVRYFNNEYSTYLFEGLKSHDNQTLHIQAPTLMSHWQKRKSRSINMWWLFTDIKERTRIRL